MTFNDVDEFDNQICITEMRKKQQKIASDFTLYDFSLRNISTMNLFRSIATL